jgi:hypothetical protein
VDNPYFLRLRALEVAHGGTLTSTTFDGPRPGLVLEWRGDIAGQAFIVTCDFATAAPHVSLAVLVSFPGPKRPKCIITLGGRHWASTAPSTALVLPGGEHMTAHCEDLALVEGYVAGGLLKQLARLVPLGTPFASMDGEGVMVTFQRGVAPDAVGTVVQATRGIAAIASA